MDDSHGYCRVLDVIEDCRIETFEPHISKPFGEEGSNLPMIFALFSSRQYQQVLDKGAKVLSGTRGCLRKDLLEMLCKSAIHTGNADKARTHLDMLITEHRGAEDTAGYLLEIEAFQFLSQKAKCLESCGKYLEVRPGDIEVIRLSRQLAVQLCDDMLAQKYELMEQSVERCYHRLKN